MWIVVRFSVGVKGMVERVGQSQLHIPWRHVHEVDLQDRRNSNRRILPSRAPFATPFEPSRGEGLG